jgi:hypothetical protein
MTQEEKQLLLIDLSARLPYGVKFQGEDSNVYTLDAANYFALQVEDVVFKPYLRPMSSMTEEEKDELNNLFNGTFQYFNQRVISAEWDNNEAVFVGELDCSKLIDWLNAHHFDYRGLIEKGLALEAPEGMYKAV